ncbi:RES family NAD+ phosphorylase [Chitinimonas lacunae]|uniref:RES family NAD+ phosphorylase n=1 Tax=Chitinimonas lacunae TaxID=1963018 RepID=A0ABV8MN59_9NEIS
MTAVVRVWRIAKETRDYQANDLSGGGAAAVGGRWNQKGTAVVYASPTIALACLETLAHLGHDIAARNRFLIEITIPEAVWQRRRIIELDSLAPTWLAEPPGRYSMEIGSNWAAAGETALLLVPSVLIHEECNVLINPQHPDAASITARVVRQFVYDPRLGGEG